MGFDTISAKYISKYFNDENSVILDIRDREDYEKGHIPYAVNIPYDDFENTELSLPKGKKYIVYCDRGGSSLLLARRMDREGYDVLSIGGGLNSYRGPLINKK